MKRFYFLITIFMGMPLASRAESTWKFANLSLSQNAQDVTLAQEKSLFPDGPSKATDGVVGRPEILISTSAAAVKKSFLKPLSTSEAIQTVVLKTGENLTIVHGGWEYESMAVRFASKTNLKKLKGQTDLEKAAYVLEWLQKQNVLGSYPWKMVETAFKNPPNHKGALGGIPVDGPDNQMNPQADIIRTGDLPGGRGGFIELWFAQGPL